VDRKKKEDYAPIERFNLRGVAPAKEVPTSAPADVAPTVQINPIDSVVRVRAVKLHESDPSQSAIYVNWIDPQIDKVEQRRRFMLRAGEAFPKPYDAKYRVKAIELTRVVYEDDAQKEFVQNVLESSSAVTSRPGGSASAPGRGVTGGGALTQGPARPAGYEVPLETRKITEHEFWISEKEAEDLGKNGLDMIGREVQTAPYVDPKTKRAAGLRVTLVRPGSTPERFGLREGDIVKEMNGVGVKSTSDVYDYANQNPGVKSVIVTVERFGRPVTFTYVIP
jgi:hypothetical protein